MRAAVGRSHARQVFRSCQFYGCYHPQIIRQWMDRHGAEGFVQWKGLLERCGLPYEDEEAWTTIRPFLLLMIRKKISKVLEFDKLINTFPVRMVSIRPVIRYTVYVKNPKIKGEDQYRLV